jgi:iron(III) transport system permease protein
MAVAPAGAPAAPSARRDRVERRPAPRVLAALGVLAMVPSVVPIALLLVTGFENGPTTAGIPPARLLDLALSTGGLALATTIGATAIGTATAWLTTRTDLPGRKMWATLSTIPLVIPSYVGALALLGASGNAGALSRLTTGIGLGALPTFRGFWAAWAALTLWNFPFVHLLVAPTLRSTAAVLEEAARGLGAGRWRMFTTIVLPQLRPALSASALLVALYTLSDFGAVSLLGYETFTKAIYAQFRGRIDVSPALFLSAMLVLLALVIIVAERRVRGRAVLHSRHGGEPPSPIPLSPRAKLLSLAFLSLLTLAALGLPASVLGYWVWRGVSEGIPIAGVAAETMRAGLAGLLAAGATIAAALPLAIITIRHRSRWSGWLESLAWSTYSLPHLAVGLAFLVVAIRFIPATYQTLVILVAAYVAMFLPQGLGAAQAALRQVRPALEDASRGLGVSALTTFRKVTLPLMSPGLAAGAAIVFLSVMKELPATLLLRPTGFETLAVRIWSAASESLYARASTAALVLLAVSSIPLYILVTREPT